MKKQERALNTAMTVFLADHLMPTDPVSRLILALALAAFVGRLVWDWVKPAWARYPATVAALAALALIVIR